MKTHLHGLYLFRSAGLTLVSLALAGIGAAHAVADVTLEAKLVPAITISGPVNSLQQIQYSTNLLDTNAWTLLSYVRLDMTSKAFYDTNASGPQRFYRTRTVGVADTNLVWIPPGTFLLGSPTSEGNRASNEGPQTEVTLTKGFFMGRFEVRNVDWLVYMTNLVSPPAAGTNTLLVPVWAAPWTAATNYCGLRTAYELAQGLIPPGWFYRLPTEAEWEYACRAGSTVCV